MPKKKTEEKEELSTEGTEAVETTEETPVEAAADDASGNDVVAATDTDSTAEVTEPAEEAQLEAAPAEDAAPAEQAAEGAPADQPAEAAPAAEAVAEPPKKTRKPAAPKAAKKKKAAEPVAEVKKSHGKRAEKVGIISSDKMMKTVTVRVDRLVKHPVYRKYVKKRKKFMAHDELGAKIGDKVKIVETRPLSARKRWRVVEIIHRAEN